MKHDEETNAQYCKIKSRVNLNAEHEFPVALIAHANVIEHLRAQPLLSLVFHLWPAGQSMSPASPTGAHFWEAELLLWGTLSCLGCRPVFWVSGLLSPAFPQASVPRVKLWMVFVAEMASIFVFSVYKAVRYHDLCSLVSCCIVQYF